MSTETRLTIHEKFKLEQDRIAQLNERRTNDIEGDEFQHYSDVVFVRKGKQSKKPDIFTKIQGLSFLQYIRPVMHWASKNSGLAKGEIELLLYVEPIGIFQKSEFNVMARVVDVNTNKLFNNLMDDGWISQWRPAKPSQKQSALFQLTYKAKKLNGRIYNMLLGKEEIPDSKANVVKTSDKPIDEYWMHVARKMNRELKDKK